MKLNANATFVKIPLAQIRETGNVRHEYDEDGIKELAESIRNNGLMNPITVKPAQEDENGEKTYELIAGHRRIRAYKYLCDQGDDFSMVECCIRTGNKLVLQIIENIQRADITPREKEDAIAEMLAENYSQADIARELSKPIQWVSDIVAGAKVRKIADKALLNTENIATKTLSQLRSIPDNELTSYLARLVAMGGTTRAATSLLNEWKNSSLRQISEYTESLPTTHESSFEESDIDEQIEGMFKDEADDIEYNDDESMIEPTVMSEADFNTSELADEALKPTTHKSSDKFDEEKDHKESRFVPGTEIDKIGERLFFKDLWTARYFVKIIDGKNIVCCITSAIHDSTTKFNYFWWKDERDDKDHNLMGKNTLHDFLVDSDEKYSHFWIYAIPDDAVETHVPNMHPTTHKSSNFETAQKGVKNPVSKKIEVRWQSFCRSKQIPEKEKTAFAFYKDLISFFENENQ
jgi:ParB/RepB/Spo0J family partition protein